MLPNFIVNGVCKKDEKTICNIGYACDGCPYNQDIKRKEIKMEKVKLSKKEQEVYDYLKNTGKEAILFNEVVEKFGEKMIGVIGKLKQLKLIDITKNCRVKSAYGTKFPKQIVLLYKENK